MSTLKAFFDAGKSIVTIGAKTNASCRQEIRNVVGSLADELDRALRLADSYLIGAQYSKDDNELSIYLLDVDRKLMHSFLEHHICAGLYHLADKFGQVFDPVRFSVTISNYHEIPELISHLKNGERAVLDDLEEMAQQLGNEASRLRNSPGQADVIRKDIFNLIDYQRHVLEVHRKKIKNLRRKIIDSL